MDVSQVFEILLRCNKTYSSWILWSIEGRLAITGSFHADKWREENGEGKRRFKINIWAIVSDYFAVTPSSQLPCLWCTLQVDYWERRSSNNRKFKSYLHVASPICYQNRCCGHSTLLFLEANVLKCMPLYKEVSAIRNAFLLACCPYWYVRHQTIWSETLISLCSTL